MKLILAIVRSADDPFVVRALVSRGYRVTRVASRGGFWRRGNVTLLIGVEDDQVHPAIDVIRQTCGPARSEEHRVALFVVDANAFQHL